MALVTFPVSNGEKQGTALAVTGASGGPGLCQLPAFRPPEVVCTSWFSQAAHLVVLGPTVSWPPVFAGDLYFRTLSCDSKSHPRTLCYIILFISAVCQGVRLI